MTQYPLQTDDISGIPGKVDLVAMQPDNPDDRDARHAACKSLTLVWRDFLEVHELGDADMSLVDGFLFLFNAPEFSRWRTLNWWEQRKYINSIKDHSRYTERAGELLSRSYLSPYINYTDDMVAKSSDRKVKQAWMRKRLVLQECFWNALDSISHAAYFQKKYADMFPALCVLLCQVAGADGGEAEMVLGIDNGAGFLCKKKNRESALFRFLYKAYRFVNRSGVFYIGGLELGLIETDSELSCHGSGAVVYQRW